MILFVWETCLTPLTAPSRTEPLEEMPCLRLHVAYLEAQAQVSFHVPAGKPQVLIALQAGCEPAVLQSLAGCQSLAWVRGQQLPH